MRLHDKIWRTSWLAALALLLGVGMAVLGLTATAHAGDDPLRVYGIVDAMPQDGRVGDWVIGGATYVTTATTEFEQENGQFAVGVCVKASLAAVDSNQVVKLQTEPAGDCDGEGGDDGGGAGDGVEIYGFVDAMPQTGLVGSWVISGTTYITTSATEFKQEFGPFAVGVCVKLHLVSGSTSDVREMETERDYHCVNATGGDDSGGDDNGGGDNHHDGEFFGVVQEVPQGFPAVMTGAWRVANVVVVADDQTEFDQTKGPLDVAVYVKVEFVIAADGSFRATEIKTALPHDGEHEGDDNSPTEDSKAFGVIDTLPAQGLIGEWIISGIAYSVTEQTELDSEGTFAQGVQVKVEYRVDAQNQRIAREIEISTGGEVSSPDHGKVVGYVEQMPANTFVGDWQIGGAAFVADSQTVFDEEHGMIVEGAFVEAEYSLVGDVRLLKKVETRVTPGAGDANNVGEVEQAGALRSTDAVNAIWRIGGQSYTVTPATHLGNGVGLDSTVVVNSFVDRSGDRVATSINNFAVVSRVFLPLTTR